MVKVVLIVSIIFLFPALLLAKREHPEKWYQGRWCREQGGRIEVVLPDKTRCDCVMDTHAIEFDYGNNWAGAVGQENKGVFILHGKTKGSSFFTVCQEWATPLFIRIDK
jgi:hypothetical protein